MCTPILCRVCIIILHVTSPGAAFTSTQIGGAVVDWTASALPPWALNGAGTWSATAPGPTPLRHPWRHARAHRALCFLVPARPCVPTLVVRRCSYLVVFLSVASLWSAVPLSRCPAVPLPQPLYGEALGSQGWSTCPFFVFCSLTRPCLCGFRMCLVAVGLPHVGPYLGESRSI